MHIDSFLKKVIDKHDRAYTRRFYQDCNTEDFLECSKCNKLSSVGRMDIKHHWSGENRGKFTCQTCSEKRRELNGF